MPFKFPSGEELLKRIYVALDLNQGYTERLVDQTIPDGPRYREYSGTVGQVIGMGFDPATIGRFRTALWNCGKMSVDAFLEHQPDLIDVGKAAIASVLAKNERPVDLIDVTRSKSNWYTYLFNKLNATAEQFSQNHLSILTYNYDRSLEFYLVTSLKHSYSLSDGEALELLRSIPIVHLHGQLSDKSFGDVDGCNYGEFDSDEALKRAASGLKIIHEEIDSHPQFKQAHELLTKAEIVCFLGFGFDATNLARLRLNDVALRAKYFGTAFDKTAAEAKEIGRLLPHDSSGLKKADLGKKTQGNLEYLREINILR